MRFLSRAFVTLLTLVACSAMNTSAGSPENDPLLAKQLEALDDNTLLILECRNAPAHRDYSNKMVYMPDRTTAFYAGGGHNGGRWCDALEYHLGSKTWVELFPKEGGEHGIVKDAAYNTVQKLQKDPNAKLSDWSKKCLAEAREWWPKYVVLKDGHLVTPGGGPLMNCHLWDGVTYDEKSGKIIWYGGAGPISLAADIHAYFTGQSTDDVKKQLDFTYQDVWMFDPAARKWIHYRTTRKLPRLDGMGASMTYIPEWGKCFFYSAAKNVAPACFTMATFDVVADKWEEIHPKGEPLSKQAGKTAPWAEAQHAYSVKHKKIVAVDKQSTYAYDIEKNEWMKLNDTVPITQMAQDCNDAGTIFAYDSVSEVWLLCEPRAGVFAAYSLTENKWELLTPKGPAMPKLPYGVGMGYYDPKFNAFVIFPAATQKVCIYRYKKAAKTE